MRNKLNILFTVFTRVCTLSFIFSSLYILIFFGRYSLLNLEYVWGILLIAFVSTIGYIPFLSEKEPSRFFLVFSRALYFILLDTVILFVGYRLRWYYPDEKRTVIGIELAVIAAFVCFCVASYILDSNKANKMNEVLKKRKQID